MEVRRLVTESGVEIAHRVEIADDFFSLARGLLGRSNLPAGEGILLVGCWNIHMFFMRFAIDVVYVDAELRVLKTRPALRPWRLSACPGAHTTIELAQGTLARHPLAPGDRLRLAPISDRGDAVNHAC